MASLLENVKPWLEADEKLAYAFTGQTGISPTWHWLSFWLIVANKPRIVVITDRRIVVLRAGQLRTSRGKPREMLFSLAPGPLQHGTRAWSKARVGSENIWMSRRLYQLMDQANAAFTAARIPADVSARVTGPTRLRRAWVTSPVPAPYSSSRVPGSDPRAVAATKARTSMRRKPAT